MPFDASTAKLAGRIGGLTRASRFSPDELTGPARSAFMRRFEPPAELDLSPEERQRRTVCNFKAYMARLALQSAVARRKSKATKS